MSTISAYTGDGSNKNFDITFSYADLTTIGVRVNNADVSFKFASPSRVTTDIAPPTGSLVEVYRETPVSSPWVDFVDGAVLQADDLDRAIRQSRDRAEELASEIAAVRQHAVFVPNDDLGVTLPSRTSRASKFFAWGPTGDPVAASGTGNDTALRTDLGTVGTPLVLHKRTGTGGEALDTKLLRFFEVEDFRRDSAGVTRSDLATLQAAFAAWQTQGTGYLVADPGRTYSLGNYGVGSPEIFPLTGLNNATFSGRGCRFTLTSTATGAKPHLFVLRNYQNLAFRDFTIQDYGTDLTVDWRGVYAFLPTGDNAANGQRGLIIDNVQVTSAVAFLYVQGSLSPVSGITVTPSCHAESCYYGLNFSENGHDVSADLRLTNGRRAYFNYGGRRHKVTVRMTHDGTSLGAEALCLLKRYGADTGEIDLTVFATGSLAPYDNIVKLEHQPNSGSGKISGISVTYRLDPTVDMAMSAAAIALYGQPAGSKVKPLTLSSYLANGTEETATTANVWSGISLHGNLGFVPGDQIVARVKPNTPVDIALAPDTNINPLKLNHKGNLRFITGPGREFLTKKGSQVGTFDIDLSRFDNVNLVLGVNVSLMGGTDGAAAQDRTYQEYNLFLWIPAGGPITVNGSPNPVNNSSGTAATITGFTVSGKVLSVNVTGAAYAGANAFGKVEVLNRDQA